MRFIQSSINTSKIPQKMDIIQVLSIYGHFFTYLKIHTFYKQPLYKQIALKNKSVPPLSAPNYLVRKFNNKSTESICSNIASKKSCNSTIISLSHIFSWKFLQIFMNLNILRIS